MFFVIRNATRQDTTSVYKLVCELESCEFHQDSFADVFNNNLNNLNIGYFIAQFNEDIIGFGSVYINTLLHHCGKVAEVQELIVTKAYQGKDIGSRLLSEMILWAKSRGSLQVEVTSNAARADALEFYKKNGFLHTHHKLVLKQE